MNRIPEHIKNDPVLSYFWKRIYYYDQNVLLLVCGGTGTCKSGSALTLGHLLDVVVRKSKVEGEKDKVVGRFNVDRVVFKAEDFISLVNSNIPKGSVIIWDETGVEHDARNYYSLKNKLVKYVMQTFRYKNFILIMTVPDLKSIDVGTRRLLHCYLEMKGPIGNRKMARGAPKLVQINPQTGKAYFKHIRFYDAKTKTKKTLLSYFVPRPYPALEDAYKAKKKIMTTEWYNSFNEQLAYMENVVGEKQKAAKAASLTIKEMADEVMKNPLTAFNPQKKRFSGNLLQPFFEALGQKVSFQKCCSTSQYLNNLLKTGEISMNVEELLKNKAKERKALK